MNNRDARLSAAESTAWARMWACHMQIPGTLDAQLKRDAGVTYFEFQALANISEAPNSARRMTELAEATTMSLSHLSRVITRLEKKGFVARIPDPKDGRSTFAALTPAGERALADALPGHLEQMRHIFFDNLTADELEVMTSVFGKIGRALVDKPVLASAPATESLDAA